MGCQTHHRPQPMTYVLPNDSVMNITVPHVKNAIEVGHHAVSLVSDCLQDLAGHGFPVNFLSTDTGR
jgi:hypothetical protein